MARLFSAPDPQRVVFTMNATQAINMALKGLLRPGDHVVTSSVEHNALWRPLKALKRRGMEIVAVPCTADGVLDPADVEASLRPNTRLMAMLHASNVLELGVERIRAHEMEMGGLLIQELQTIPGLTILGPGGGLTELTQVLAQRTAAVSVTVEGYSPDQLAAVLDQAFDVATRAGLHCSPQAHQTAGTLDCGALRFSPGYFTTAEDIRYAVESLREIV